MLNVMSLVLIMIELVQIGIYTMADRRELTGEDSFRGKIEIEVSSQQKNTSHPDIYYIILDAYCRADILSEMYHHDNSDFLNYLTDNGFYVADQSRSALYPVFSTTG